MLDAPERRQVVAVQIGAQVADGFRVPQMQKIAFAVVAKAGQSWCFDRQCAEVVVLKQRKAFQERKSQTLTAGQTAVDLQFDQLPESVQLGQFKPAQFVV